MIFCGSLTHGGAERVLSILSTPFAEHYDSVDYVTWYDLPVFYTIHPKIRLICMEKEVGKSFVKKVQWFRRYVNRSQPSLVVSFSTPFNMIALLASIGSKTKVVVAERNDPRSFRWGWILKKCRDILYHKAVGILVQTEHNKNYFTGKLLDKTSVIYNPIAMPSGMVGSATKIQKRPLIVTAARLVPQKQQALLIECFARFSSNHPEYKLEIYGTGPELANLQHKADECGVRDKVFFPGNVHDLWQRILPAQMFIMTSLFEGMSNSLIEAMCLGLPCISTKVSGATDLLKHGINGFLVDIGDKDEICKCMEQIASDEQMALIMGSKASEVYNILNVEQISRQWIEYISNMVNS